MRTVWRIAIGLVAAASLALIITAANAQPAMAQECNEREYTVKLLYRQYREQVFALGLTDNNYVVELFLSPKHDSWTLVKTHPSGISCFIDSGGEWVQEKEEVDSEKIKAIQ